MAHLDTSAKHPKATVNPLDRLDIGTQRRLRLVTLAYCTASYVSAAIYFAAWAYAVSHDPWLTPRHTHYMTV